MAALLTVALLLVLGAAPGPSGNAAASSPAPAATSWVKDSVKALNIFLPDADSDYYINGFGTAGGDRTVVSGRVPEARYWSFTAYPTASGAKVEHVHDTEIAQSDGRYKVTLSASCSGIRGTCLATGTRGATGVLVLRIYVPVDVNGAGTGGVPLPQISYLSRSGSTRTLTQASGSPVIGNVLALLRRQNGALPAALTLPYPAPAPVPVPVLTPIPVGVRSGAKGVYANPDNLYDHLAYTSKRGDLVIRAEAPTYRSDSFRAANDLSRPSSASAQVRYWSLCTVLKGRHTGACLRDEQIHLAAGSRAFTVIVSPTCPVAGYANCLPAGPEPLQQTLSYRNLLPSPGFAAQAFRGPYALRATYVARPG
jgi:hypothetical protein